jgi:hypothetical protein
MRPDRRPFAPHPSGRHVRIAFTLLLTLGVSACGLRREKPPETVPNAVRPDGTPVVEEPRAPSFKKIDPEEEKKARADTTRAPGHIAAMIDLHMPSIRSAAGQTLLPEQQSSMVSIEGTYLPLSGNGVGVTARIIVGGNNTPQYTELGFLVGSRQIALDLGVATRRGFNTFTTGIYDSTHTTARLGLRSRLNLGESGFSLQSRAGRYIGFPEPRGLPNRAVPQGWNAETGVSWTWPGRIPFTANLGYRIERFRAWNLEQEVSSLTFGTGLLFGRRPGL